MCLSCFPKDRFARKACRALLWDVLLGGSRRQHVLGTSVAKPKPICLQIWDSSCSWSRGRCFPPAGTSVAVIVDGRDASILRCPWRLTTYTHCQHHVPSLQGGFGTGVARGQGLEGSRQHWHGAGRQDRGSSGEASAAGASSGEPHWSQDASGHGDLDRLLPWDAEVITHTSLFISADFLAWRFIHSCRADKVMSAPALLGWAAFPLAQ